MPRPRLARRLDRATTSKLTLVSAPAGFGKTTRLAEWPAGAGRARRRARRRVAVARPRRQRSTLFWADLIAALRTAAPDVGSRALALLEAPQPPSIHTVLTELLNDLGAVTRDLVLVLDDYRVLDSREVQEGWHSCSIICPRGCTR